MYFKTPNLPLIIAVAATKYVVFVTVSVSV